MFLVLCSFFFFCLVLYFKRLYYLYWKKVTFKDQALTCSLFLCPHITSFYRQRLALWAHVSFFCLFFLSSLYDSHSPHLLFTASSLSLIIFLTLHASSIPLGPQLRKGRPNSSGGWFNCSVTVLLGPSLNPSSRCLPNFSPPCSAQPIHITAFCQLRQGVSSP